MLLAPSAVRLLFDQHICAAADTAAAAAAALGAHLPISQQLRLNEACSSSSNGSRDAQA
jgi:hypothetical protein